MQATIPTPAGHAVVTQFDPALIALATFHNRIVFADNTAFEQFTKADGTGEIVRTLAL
jgi:hypothetical protein